MEYLANREYQINNVNEFVTFDTSNKLGFWRYCSNLKVSPEPFWFDLLVAKQVYGIT